MFYENLENKEDILKVREVGGNITKGNKIPEAVESHENQF